MLKKRVFINFFLICVFLFNSIGCSFAEVKTGDREMTEQDYLIKEAIVPQIPQYPELDEDTAMDEETEAQFQSWWDATVDRQSILIPDEDRIRQFVLDSTRILASGQKEKNFLYSPVSLWFCLQTMAGLTEGNCREQILDVVGNPPADAGASLNDRVYRSLYWDDGVYACLPMISLWLNDHVRMAPSFAEALAAEHASVFQGKMGDEAYDHALRSWLDEKTNGLLEKSVSDIRFAPDADFSVCSALYIKNNWSRPFSREKTSPNVFYSGSREIQAEYMHGSSEGVIWNGDGFTSMALDFTDGGYVLFILPDENVSPEDLLMSDALDHFLFAARDWEDGEYGRINYSVPKLDCLADMPLRDTLEELGITDIFDSDAAQFVSGMSSDREMAMSSLQQFARLVMDEDGVEAAAVTISDTLTLLIPSENEIDFNLNRPFLYAVMSDRDIPLFLGTVYAP